MKLLFLTIGDIPSIRHHEIYPDLLRQFIKNGHEVFVVCSCEKRVGLPTHLVEEDGAKLLKVHIGNITKTNMLEKGISTLMIGKQYNKAIRKFFLKTKFDLIMYSTPPITLAGVVQQLKRNNGACTYLLLKDIFPQNAVDIGLMNTTGIKGLVYKHFRNQEIELYNLSDKIGCMSQANVDYIIKHNPYIDSSKVEVCPNCIEIEDKSVNKEMRNSIRDKYSIPQNKKIFIYGGNLGKPQNIPFLIDCINECSDIEDAFFLIVGDGTEYDLLERFVSIERPKNLRLIKRLPKEDFDIIVGACDVGLIMLDHRFTIPNYPSRVLAYMQAQIPVFACTDPTTDLPQMIEEEEFGWWCESNSTVEFKTKIECILKEDLNKKGKKAFKVLNERFSSEQGYKIIMESISIYE